jgi:4-hydroxybenzoate polyprenyltransferase
MGVLIGFVLSGKPLDITVPLALCAAACALGFGNVINDIVDYQTDSISHPHRPIPRGDMTLRNAELLCGALFLAALIAAGSISPTYFGATLVPLCILIVYSLFLKGTPFAGNITVSALIAYTLFYGALGGQFSPVYIPAVIAFLLNLVREIIKDLADKEGDVSAGITTTASIPLDILQPLIFLGWAMSGVSVFLPLFTLSHIPLYSVVLVVCVLPAHVLWLWFFTQSSFSQAAKIIKIEMLAGLTALVCTALL